MGIFSIIGQAWASLALALEDDDVAFDEYFVAVDEARLRLTEELNRVEQPTIWFWRKLMKHITEDKHVIEFLIMAEELDPEWKHVLRSLYTNIPTQSRLSGRNATGESEEKRNSLLLGPLRADGDQLMADVIDAIDDMRLDAMNGVDEQEGQNDYEEGHNAEGKSFIKKPRLEITYCPADCRLDQWAEFLIDFKNDLQDFGIKTEKEKIRYLRRSLAKGSQERVYT